nr:NUDIX hydrolase [Micromonospora sp. NBC_00855]
MSSSAAHPQAEFTVTGSRERYRSPWLTLREDDLVFPDGTLGTYSVVDRASFSLAVPELTPGRLVMVSMYRHVVGRRFWEFPQGGQEGPDGDPTATAAAELAQEAGYHADSWQRLGTLHEAYGYCTSTCDVLLATGLTAVGQSPESAEGVVHVQPFDVEEIWDMVTDQQVTDAVTVAALALYERLRRTEPRPAGALR